MAFYLIDFQLETTGTSPGCMCVVDRDERQKGCHNVLPHPRGWLKARVVFLNYFRQEGGHNHCLLDMKRALAWPSDNVTSHLHYKLGDKK